MPPQTNYLVLFIHYVISIIFFTIPYRYYILYKHKNYELKLKDIIIIILAVTFWFVNTLLYDYTFSQTSLHDG